MFTASYSVHRDSPMVRDHQLLSAATKILNFRANLLKLVSERNPWDFCPSGTGKDVESTWGSTVVLGRTVISLKRGFSKLILPP